MTIVNILKNFTHRMLLQAFLGAVYLCSAHAAGYMEDMDLVTDETEILQTTPYVMRHRHTSAEKRQIFQEVERNLQAYDLQLNLTQIVNRNKLNLRGKLSRFSCNQQQEILIEICRFSWLTELNCSHNFLSVMPDQIGQLSSLKYLNCSHNRFDYLPDQICQLTSLRSLDCSHNYLINLPENIGQLSNLTNFNCSANLLNFVPISVQNFVNFRISGAFNLRENTLYIHGSNENLAHVELMHFFGDYISLDPVQNINMILDGNNIESSGDDDLDLILRLVRENRDFFWGAAADSSGAEFFADEEMQDSTDVFLINEPRPSGAEFFADEEMEDVFEEGTGA